MAIENSLSENLVIIPAFNQSKELGRVLNTSVSKLFDMIIVDDGSEDNTALIASNYGVKILRNKANLGYGAAVKIGIEYAKSKKYKRIITLDADGAHNINEIHNVLSNHIWSKSKFTIGSRFLDSGDMSGNFPDSKQAANIFATSLFNKAFNTKFTDVASGFRVIETNILDDYFSNDMGFTYELLFNTIKKNYKINETEISVKYNAEKLFATDWNELLALLRILQRFTTKTSIFSKRIDQLVTEFESFNKINIKIENDYMIIYPLKSEGVYVFQKQNPFFVFEPSEYIQI